MLSDGRVALRAFTERHANDTYLSWFKDPEVAQFITHRPETLSAAKAYVTGKLLDHDCRFFSIDWKRERIGTLKLQRDTRDRAIWWLGLMIGDPCARGHGLGSRAIWLGCCYAFDTLKAGKIMAGIDHANKASVRCFEKAGFCMASDPEKIVAWKTP